jgi:hypothetical protein
LSILASENLFKGRHVKNNIRRSFADTQFGMLDRVIESGVKCGEFKPDCDSFHLYLSILSLTYFYRANLYTLSSYMQIDLADAETTEGMACPCPDGDRRSSASKGVAATQGSRASLPPRACGTQRYPSGFGYTDNRHLHGDEMDTTFAWRIRRAILSGILLVVGPRPFQRDRRYDAAMLMRPDTPTALDPENIGDGIGSHVEAEMLDRRGFAKGHPRVCPNWTRLSLPR